MAYNTGIALTNTGDIPLRLLTTFPHPCEAAKARRCLDGLGLAYEVVEPTPGYAVVGAPALILEEDARLALARSGTEQFVSSGWVDCRLPATSVPDEPPPQYAEDVFGRAAVMVLARCSADADRVRIIAHISGDLTPAMPYLNAEMPQACYNPGGPTFTFMDAHRMVTLYARRIAVAKAEELVDAWRVLEGLRRRTNETWARRHEITPSDEMRRRPPALEIYKRLPHTNCSRCGEAACLAFAVKVHGGELPASLCLPVFDGEHAGLRDALIEVCRAVGAEV